MLHIKINVWTYLNKKKYYIRQTAGNARTIYIIITCVPDNLSLCLRVQQFLLNVNWGYYSTTSNVQETVKHKYSISSEVFWRVYMGP